MKFNSQICTTKEQSERLLALGLKKETADMMFVVLVKDFRGKDVPNAERIYSLCTWYKETSMRVGLEKREYIPAWSLHRLIEMMPDKIRVYDSTASLIVSNEKVQYYLHDVEYSDYLTGAGRWKSENIYDNIIDCIGWLIIEGYFNKKYLEERV